MRVRAGSFVRPLASESVAGDACLVEPWGRGVLVAAADGLGHGPAAAVAATLLVDRVRAARSAPLAVVLEEAHRALLKTRGAVAAVARFDELSQIVEVAGLGNVTALLATGSGDPKPIVLPAGVLGSAFRPVRPQVLDFAAGDVLVLHTDGVQGRLSLGRLRALSPRALAEAIVAKYGKTSDDAGCVVAMGAGAPVSGHAEGEGDAGATTLALRLPTDGDRCAAEARGFAARHGFTVMAQWQLGIAIAELAAGLQRGALEGRLTLTLAREPREAIVVAASGAGGSLATVDLASVTRMMDRVAVEPSESGARVIAWKHRA